MKINCMCDENFSDELMGQLLNCDKFQGVLSKEYWTI